MGTNAINLKNGAWSLQTDWAANSLYLHTNTMVWKSYMWHKKKQESQASDNNNNDDKCCEVQISDLFARSVLSQQFQ